MNVTHRQIVAGAVLISGAVALVIVRPARLVPHPVLAGPPPSPGSPALAHDEPPLPIVVYVAGAVVKPGVYRIPATSRINDALAHAGGPKPDADVVAVNLAAHVSDGQEIVVPRAGQVLAQAPALTGATALSTHRRKHRGTSQRNSRSDVLPEQAGAAVDINRADAATLAALPGIGPTLAERIVAFRAINGPFASVDGLGDVAGITPARLDALTPLLVVRP